MQIYMDDPLACLVGGTLMLLTMGALGLTLAWHKGHRADRLVWIGVTFRLDWEDGYVVVSVPEKMMKEIEAAIREWGGQEDGGAQAASHHRREVLLGGQHPEEGQVDCFHHPCGVDQLPTRRRGWCRGAETVEKE